MINHCSIVLPLAFIQGEDKVKSEKFDPECSTTVSSVIFFTLSFMEDNFL